MQGYVLLNGYTVQRVVRRYAAGKRQEFLLDT
jgi:hypothetical protein